MDQTLPLAGLRVIETASTVAGAYAGQLLNAMGAEVILIEPPGLCPLRKEPPFLGDSAISALFLSLSAGKKSVLLDLTAAAGREELALLLADAAILIDDTPLDRRPGLGLSQEQVAAVARSIVHCSVLPFGAEGPKCHWQAEEISLFHAGGEGFLMPNGLTAELYPDAPPLKVYGHFAERQAGVAAAFGALAALHAGQGQYVDVSGQDANLAVGAFAIQRLGDGSVEHRAARSFKYGGVIECADGFVELLTLEERQWQGLVQLLGSPDWITDPALADPIARSARGAELNHRIRAWARGREVAPLVAAAQRLGVPMARYTAPAELPLGVQESARGLFAQLSVPGVGAVPLQTAPFRFGETALPLRGPVPEPGADQDLVSALRAEHHPERLPGRIAV